MTAKDYLYQVDLALGDLPWRQRHELVAELEAHIAELPPGENLVERLGSPERYAADLRDAAGLERRHGLLAFARARRPRNVVIAVVAAVAIGLAIGGGVWIAKRNAWIGTYQPIVPGNGSQYPPFAHLALGADLEEVQLRPAKPLSIGVTFANHGRFGVHVTGISPQLEAFPAKGHFYLWGPAPDNGGYGTPRRRFHPFDLGPGQAAYVLFRGTYYAKCQPSTGGSSWGFTGFDVHFTFRGQPSYAPIRLNPPLQIDSPKGYDCRQIKYWHTITDDLWR